ncbi:MAG: hypothetical protein M3N45_08970 [Actinomycetota bacterium]|nr:hypothetical protein [Actinomycetota bacterium]
MEEVEEAAEKYRVPKELLLAIGYVNTHWEMPPPQASAYEEGELDGKGTYGIMASSGTLRRTLWARLPS